MPKGPSLRRKNSRINRRACRPQSCLSGRGARSGKWEYILEKIAFCPDGGEAVEFYVLEQTKLFGHPYILVTEEEEGDGEALILKEITGSRDGDTIYEIVEDETELRAVADVFENLLEDVSLTDGEEL